jgi:peroxiredoxin/uncharacterized membrane protein YphA (DoxX/SURF4 family)
LIKKVSCYRCGWVNFFEGSIISEILRPADALQAGMLALQSEEMELLLLLVRLFLAAIFMLAGVGKLLDLEGSEKAVKDFGTPPEMAKFFAVALPCAEIVFAVMLLFTETSWLGAIGALVLLLTFIGGMIWQMAQGKAPDCHCFGQIHSEPVSRKSLIRNIVFAALALVLIGAGRENQGLSFSDLTSETDFMQIILGLAAVGLLAAVAFYLKKISEQQVQIMRRIEVIELLAHEDGKQITREDVETPHEGLPIGAPAPDFEAKDLNGKLISFEQFLAKGKPMLFFFVSPTCAPCAALLPEIEQWQAELKDKLDFVFVSSGKAKENAEKLGGASFKQILLQNENEIADKFYAKWTPTAVLINHDGTIGSRLAAGDKAIRELVEKIKAQNLENDLIFVGANGHSAKLGQPIPEFALNDIQGNQISAADFRGRKTLVTFWSLTCPHCTNMLEELREWDKTKGQDEPDLVVISTGKPEDHSDLDLKSPVLLDDEHKTSQELGMAGTPSAVLINEDGKIVSETAAGATEIWKLVGRR